MSPLEEVCLGAVLVLAGAVWWLFGMRVLEHVLGRSTGRTFGEPPTGAIAPAVARWGLALLAFSVGGWLIGDALAARSVHSTGGTLGYLGQTIGGAALAATSVPLWRVYPWLREHNPISRKSDALILSFRRWLHRRQVRDISNPYLEDLQPAERDELKRWGRREALRMDREMESSWDYWHSLGRIQFAVAPAIIGGLIFGIGLYQLLGS